MTSSFSTRKVQTCQLFTLSWLPAAPGAPIVMAFDPFQPGLFELLQAEPFARDILTWWQTGQWPPHLTKKDINQNLELCRKTFNDKDGLIWFRSTDYNYTHTALFLPQKYHMWNTQQHFWRSQHYTQDLHQNNLLLLLARHISGCQMAHTNMSHLSASKKGTGQTNSTGTAVNTRMTQLEDSRWFIQTHVDSW